MHFLTEPECADVVGGLSAGPTTLAHVIVAIPEPMPGLPYRLPFHPIFDVD